jgi:hypothetical protein
LLPHLNLYSTRVNKYNSDIDVINGVKAITSCNKASGVISRIAKLFIAG